MAKQSYLSLLCLAVTWLGVAAQNTTNASSMPTVTISAGTIVGTTTQLPAATAPVNKFLGIPFAQSPPERFSPAQPASAYNATLMAQTYSPACIQQFNYPEAMRNFSESIFNFPPPPDGESEDCLYLNIFTPSGSPPADGWTVMFWIFGGGFQFGSGTLALYDGSAFAGYNDVIVVTPNYRTNVFGFPGYSQLPLAERNLGLLDQRLAMQWVQDNIEAFGGAPGKVTIFGESAGGFSVDAHLTSFTTDTAPFRAAIMESGQVSYQTTNSTQTNNDMQFEQLAQLANCTGDILTCLRALPAATINSIDEHNAIVFTPVIDNYTYVPNRAIRRANGQFAQVPTLIGTNANEGRIFSIGLNNITAYVESIVGSNTSSLTTSILNAFPVTGNESDYDQISNLQTLIIFQCGSAYLAELNMRQNISSWRYLFNASFPNSSPFNGLFGVYHGSELPIVFSTYPGGPINAVSPDQDTVVPVYLQPTAQQYALSSYMNSAWARFAKSPFYGPGWGKIGSFDNIDIAVLGGSNAMGSGAEMVNSSIVDGMCDVLRPLFEMGSGVTLPLLG